jgi:hypothetical protein
MSSEDEYDVESAGLEVGVNIFEGNSGTAASRGWMTASGLEDNSMMVSDAIKELVDWCEE